MKYHIKLYLIDGYWVRGVIINKVFYVLGIAGKAGDIIYG